MVKKISLKELRKIVSREAKRILIEKEGLLNSYIGSFYCFEEVGENDNEEERHFNEAVGIFYMKKKKYDVYVYNRDDGNIPHMHIISDNFESCVMLEKASYFLHKKRHKLMTNRAINAFYEFMKAKNRGASIMGYVSNYLFAVMSWNNSSNRNDVKVVKDNDGKIIVPNYSLLRV